MKPILLLIFLVLVSVQIASGQFQEKNYLNFRDKVKDLTLNGLKELYPSPVQEYYMGYDLTPASNEIVYLDSTVQKLQLTGDEQDLLMQNHFVVTERLNSRSMGEAYHRIFNSDLPVFVTTDLILHALHTSYDNILKGAEGSLMMPNLKEYLTDLFNTVPVIAAKYGNTLPKNVQDVDLYLTVALSLLNDTKLQPRFAGQENYDQIMAAIQSETLTPVYLFTDSTRLRAVDFSQFKVRGHYVYTEYDKGMNLPNLEPYFRTMMWLGRIDFPMTPPPTGGMEPPWTFKEIQRMNISACILNEMMQNSAKKGLLQQNDELVTYLVGESDNLTSDEYTGYLQSKGISEATQLLDSLVYTDYQSELSTNPDFEQKYMGAFYYVDLCGDKPDTLPVSFMLSGQRFIIDSYILANVVFDRIIYQGAKIYRMMPDPLDALYSLGNDDALYFLEDELNIYPYATQLALMRYLIDSKEPQFWDESLYNVWLSSVRALNPAPDSENMPFFMRTGAWHQQKMNTQLAAWTQLRHDNLLYAKPSYTGGAGCSFPYSYVEPYPDFYKRLGDYANAAAGFFSGKDIHISFMEPIDQFFGKFATVMFKLEVLAQKELDSQPFSADEEDWLKQMLVKKTQYECGQLPFTGWIVDLFWDPQKIAEDDFINVDIHTQPTDKSGNIVGKVLHTGLGEINLGVCLAKIPGTNTVAAYSGAFMSYYENITTDFLRLTDQDWTQKVYDGTLPTRPEWINSYCVDKNGVAFTEEKSFPTTMLVGINSLKSDEASDFVKVYPNPTSSQIFIKLLTPAGTEVYFSVSDICGREIKSGLFTSDVTSIDFTSFPNGLYIVKLTDGEKRQFTKVIKD